MFIKIFDVRRRNLLSDHYWKKLFCVPTTGFGAESFRSYSELAPQFVPEKSTIGLIKKTGHVAVALGLSAHNIGAAVLGSILAVN